MNQCIAYLELALPHHREAARIYRCINHVGTAGWNLQAVAEVEEKIRQVEAATADARG